MSWLFNFVCTFAFTKAFMTRALKRRHADYPETISLNTIEEVPPNHDQSTIRPTRKGKNFWHRKAIRCMRSVIAFGCFVLEMHNALRHSRFNANTQMVLAPCVSICIVYWDIHRLLHELYQKPPGFHLEVYLVLEACFSILALIYICLDHSSAEQEGIYVKYSITIPLMLISFWITTQHLLRYPSRRRQRHKYFTRKPTLVFTSSGNPVAVYVRENASGPTDVRRLSLDSLLEYTEPRRA